MSNPFDWKSDKTPSVMLQSIHPKKLQRQQQTNLEKARRVIEGGEDEKPYKQPFRPIAQFNYRRKKEK